MKKLSTFATEMRVARLRLGQTQGDFSKSIGVSAAYISYVETSHCKPPAWLLAGYKRFLKNNKIDLDITDDMLNNHCKHVVAEKNKTFVGKI